MPAPVTKEEWYKRAVKVHGNKYDYSLVEYVGYMDLVKIICPTHGVFSQTPKQHVFGGCRKCGREVYARRRRKIPEEFIKDAIEIHGDKYDYSLTKYKNNRTIVTIICPNHGEFRIKALNHLIQKQGCRKCTGRYPFSQDEWIQKARSVHGDKYDYSQVEYHGCERKVKIICKKHGFFYQAPFSHLQNHGCPSCNSSKGEAQIAAYLKSKNIIFEPQKTFNDCRGSRRPLPFDFFVPNLNLIIEYHGRQHFEKGSWGGDKGLTERQKLDCIKKKFCLDKGFKFMEIRYDEDTVALLNKVIS